MKYNDLKKTLYIERKMYLLLVADGLYVLMKVCDLSRYDMFKDSNEISLSKL